MVKEDMQLVCMTEEDAEHRARWKWMICCGNPYGEKPKEEDEEEEEEKEIDKEGEDSFWYTYSATEDPRMKF